MKHPYLDVLIVGAGLSGIGAACHLKEKCPNVRFGIVERRKRIGGTWDLFRYPGTALLSVGILTTPHANTM